MRLPVFLVSLLLCAVGMFSLGRWLFLKKRRRSRSVDLVEPVQPGTRPPTGHKLFLNKQETLPPGFDREFEAGDYPPRRDIPPAFETILGFPALYAGTVPSKTI